MEENPFLTFSFNKVLKLLVCQLIILVHDFLTIIPSNLIFCDQKDHGHLDYGFLPETSVVHGYKTQKNIFLGFEDLKTLK